MRSSISSTKQCSLLLTTTDIWFACPQPIDWARASHSLQRNERKLTVLVAYESRDKSPNDPLSSSESLAIMLQCGRYRLTSSRSFIFPSVRRLLSTFEYEPTAEARSRSDPIRGVVQSPVNTSIVEPYDVIVIGGGHAGCEGNPSGANSRMGMPMCDLL